MRLLPTSLVRNRFAKKNRYERFGVQEYWLAGFQNQEVELYALNQNRYELLSAAVAIEGTLTGRYGNRP